MINRSVVLAALAATLVTLGTAPSDASSAGDLPATAGSQVSVTLPEVEAPATTPATDTPVPVSERQRVLDSPMRGRAAVRALGAARLRTVAAHNDLAPSGLERLLTEDPTAWVSEEGRVFYQEATPEETTTPASAATTVAPSYPTSQTFALHSRAGSAHKIFLDFNGANVSNTAWNGTTSGKVPNGSHIGYDVDGSPTSFSTSEQGWIQEVWREVAEIYSPFDVDVTTADPGTSALTRTSTSDTTYGTHVVITSSSVPRTKLCTGCLGIAWLGTFDYVDASARYQPAWVFAYDAGFDPMIVAQAAAHETGHTLGLQHDGTTTASYYPGTSAWGPIMGSSYTRAVSQFSKGEYARANNTEDDLAIIQANGLPLRADDHGSTVGTADRLGTFSSYAAKGVIGTRSDTDVFAVTLSCTTDLAVAATGIGRQTALDLSVQVLNAAGTPVATSSPASGWRGTPPLSTGMDATVTAPAVSAGTYYLRVDGVGNGNPATTGWSDYGSLGQYSLSATGCASAPAPAQGNVALTAPTPPAAVRPSAPRIGVATPGAKNGAVTATARWNPPTSTGGAAITRYRVLAQRLDSKHRVVHSYLSSYLASSARGTSLKLPKASYTFKVMAWNKVGGSAWSSVSRTVLAR